MTENTPLPDRIPATPKTEATPAIGSGDASRQAAPGFQAHMQEVGPGAQPPKTTAPSPMELAGHPAGANFPTTDTLLAQVKMAATTMGDIQNQFASPNLKLKQSQKYLLKNKLSEASAHIRSANTRMGAAVPNATEDEDPDKGGPFGRFFSYLTDGQNQLQAAEYHLHSLQSQGDALNPADLLLVQIKLNKAQQELDYSSMLLGKAVDDVKQIFQVQL